KLALKAREEAAQKAGEEAPERAHVAAPLVKATQQKITDLAVRLVELQKLVTVARAGGLDGQALLAEHDPRLALADAEGAVSVLSDLRTLPATLQSDAASVTHQLPVLKQQLVEARAQLAAIRPMPEAKLARLRNALKFASQAWTITSEGEELSAER